MLSKKGKHDESHNNDSHSCGGENPWIVAIRKFARNGSNDGHENRLSDKDHACIPGGKTQYILKIKAEQKGNGKGGGIINQGRQVRKGK